MAEQLTRRDLLRKGATFGAAAAVALATPAAFAQEPIALQEPQHRFIEAAKWARANDGIGIYVALGNDAGLDPAALEQNFETGFKQHFGVNANAFIEVMDTPGSSVSYYIGETVTEPEPFHTGTSSNRIKQIVDEYKAYTTAGIKPVTPVAVQPEAPSQG